jgi:hypothetical protein
VSNWWDDGPLGTPGSGDGESVNLPPEWFGVEETLFMDMVFDDPIIANDAYLQALFDQAMFDPELPAGERESAYNAMVEYLWDEYGLDFEDVFDWEDYRDWYEST